MARAARLSPGQSDRFECKRGSGFQLKNNWHVEQADEEEASKLSEELQIPHLLAMVLVSRGHDDVEEAGRFLHPDLDRDWNDPSIIPGISDVADVLEGAIRSGKRTVIFGDFDVDGITATAVMILGLRAYGLEAEPFIPQRGNEGYGLSYEAIDRLMGISSDDWERSGTSEVLSPGTSLPPEVLVTVDCGITSFREVERLKELGVEVAITDHHNVLDSVPKGVPVCNPKLDPANPSSGLAGVGVALKAIQVLGERFGKPDVWKGLIDLAALGTIADRMPLLGENRALVRAGVDMIRENPRPGIAASLAYSNEDIQNVTSTALSFSLIPRLNAAGRMTDAMDALDLVLCENPAEAQGYAKNLEDINTERRQAEMDLAESAEIAAEQQYSGGRVLVLAGEGWHEGVKGIVASRLANKYGVPTILFSIEGDVAHGSGRSVGEIDLFAAISSVSDLMVKFGGHKFAVGVTVRTEDIDEFRRRLEDYFESFSEDDFVASLHIDGTLGFDDLDMRQVESLEMLEPYGQDNEEPVFAMNRVFIARARAVGANKNHLSFSITNGVENATAIYFHCDDTEEYISNVAPVDLAFVAEVEEWRGRKQLKLKVKDMGMGLAGESVEDGQSNRFIERLYEHDHDESIFRRPPIELQEPARVQGSQVQAAIGNREETGVWAVPQQDDGVSGDEGFIEEMTTALTGQNGIRLHQSQRAALEALCRGENTLAIMATGRGKSLIFYVYAAIMALKHGKKSIFVYPLRALINDQAFHVGQDFAMLGITVQTLTGETSQEDRQKIYAQWDSGEVPIILTTPEYLYVHRDRLSQAGDVGFLAIDEAHYIGVAREGNRPVYTQMRTLRSSFPDATVLAVTATAPTEVADRIEQELSIDRVVIDRSQRYNLRIDDKRGISNRQTYMASIVATGEKTVVYVNSRESSIELARMLRKRLPDQAMQIAFYNAGLSRDVRLTIERLFREGEITAIIATGAFGEGINVSDIRHIVLYHMPLSRLSYNQMSGRCGRDGKPAYIHLIFDASDISVNHRILERQCPSRDELAFLYKMCRALNDQKGCPVNGDDLLAACNATSEGASMTMSSVNSGMGIFAELGLAEVTGSSLERYYTIKVGSERVDIASSVRYQEALRELQVFDEFADWLLNADTEILLNGVNRPLLPENV